MAETESPELQDGASGRDGKGRFTANNPWALKPGESGHLRGRADSLLDHLRRLGQEQLESGKTRNAALAEGLWSLALDNRSPRIKLQAIEMLLDRMHGKPSQSLRLGMSTEQLSDGEIVAQVQATLTERGLSPAESERFLLALGVGDEFSDTE